jgi:hypothetical protein
MIVSDEADRAHAHVEFPINQWVVDGDVLFDVVLMFDVELVAVQSRNRSSLLFATRLTGF